MTTDPCILTLVNGAANHTILVSNREGRLFAEVRTPEGDLFAEIGPLVSGKPIEIRA